MKSQKLGLALVGTVLTASVAGMILTNPGSTAYQEYAVEKLNLELKEKGCSQEVGALKVACHAMVAWLLPEMGGIISQGTERKNFLFFSIYSTDLSLDPSLPSYHFETVGVFHNFYTYRAEKI